MDFKYCKLEIFIPETHLPVLQKTLREVDAGHIGNYDSCMSSSEVIGYWRPLEGCNPYIGNEGEISKEPEVRLKSLYLQKQLTGQLKQSRKFIRTKNR